MLYEFGFQLHFFSDLVPVMLMVGIPLYSILCSSGFDNKIAKFLIFLVSAFLTLTLFVVFIVSPIYSYNKIKQYIKEDNLLTVEGEVSEFESPEKSEALGGHVGESFKIDNVDFSYNGTENYGYDKFLCFGGVVKGNGQKLKISYCYDPITDEKVICFIQEIQE